MLFFGIVHPMNIHVVLLLCSWRKTESHGLERREAEWMMTECLFSVIPISLWCSCLADLCSLASSCPVCNPSTDAALNFNPVSFLVWKSGICLCVCVCLSCDHVGLIQSGCETQRANVGRALERSCHVCSQSHHSLSADSVGRKAFDPTTADFNARSCKPAALTQTWTGLVNHQGLRGRSNTMSCLIAGHSEKHIAFCYL